MTVDRGIVTFTVREDRTGGDHARVQVTPDRIVTISAGPGGVAPVYVATDGHWLIGSWDPADLAAFASAGALTPAVVARLLTRRHRYSSDTLFSTVTRVTAGATLTWDGAAGLSVRYPEPAEHVVRPRRVRSGADPVAHLGYLLDREVGEVCEQHRGAVAVELSGGLDSANGAVAASHHAPGILLSGGLVVAGPTGIAQAERRRILVEHLGLHDLAVPAAEHLPLDPSGPRTASQPHYPDGDVYQEAFDTLRSRLHAAGARVVLTGFAGDEIMSLAPYERAGATRSPRTPPWLDVRSLDALREVDAGTSPVTAVALPTLLVFAARHPHYLRAGLWPVAPFASPALSRFGRSLPVEWRTGKELLRQRLARAGLPGTVTHPRRPESFAATMHTALRRHAPALFGDMLEYSVLIEHGFVRRSTVHTLHRHAHDGRAFPGLLYDMLALDIGLRSLTTTPIRRQEEGRCTPTPTP